MAMVAENRAKNVNYSPLQQLRFPTMSAEDNTVVPRKLKFKITSKGIRGVDSEETSQKNPVKAVVDNGQRDGATGGRNNQFPEKVLVKPCMPANSNKRSAEASLDGERPKRRKMDPNVKQLCSRILRELMTHSAGWIFNEPVDPVKLHIPDYFSIIAEPMDLGTIKRKLEGNKYSGAHEFAGDVRLTFSNAVLYNPPGHEVHTMAKKLDGNFSRRWKSMETQLKHENSNVENGSFVGDMGRNGQQHMRQTVETKPLGLNKAPACVKLSTCRPMSSEGKDQQDFKPMGLNKAPPRLKLGTCRPMPSEEKKNLKLELLRLSSTKMVENVRIMCQKFGLTGFNEERVDSFIDSTDDGSLWKLRGEIKSFLDARDGKVDPTRMSRNGCRLPVKTFQKEQCGPSACSFANHRQSLDSTAAQCSSCGSRTCHCRSKNGSAQASSSDVSSERSSEHGHCGESKLDCNVKNALASRTRSSGIDSDGPGVVVNQENSSHQSTPAATASSGEGWSSFSAQMSPKKALRAAMLKSRFADTIFKATHQAILDHGDKSDPASIQLERERLEREQLAEKARIESEIKAAEAASRRKAQDELTMQRQREREAARLALQKMERTVKIDENLNILRELEVLCCSPPGCDPGYPLARLGLFMKEDYLEEDEDDEIDNNGNLSGEEEEGEIL